MLIDPVNPVSLRQGFGVRQGLNGCLGIRLKQLESGVEIEIVQCVFDSSRDCAWQQAGKIAGIPIPQIRCLGIALGEQLTQALQAASDLLGGGGCRGCGWRGGRGQITQMAEQGSQCLVECVQHGEGARIPRLRRLLQRGRRVLRGVHPERAG